MNNLKKHIVVLSILFTATICIFLPSIHYVQADNSTVKLLVGDLPGFEGTQNADGTLTVKYDLIHYTQLIYKLSIGLAGVIGFAMITVGGFQYLVSEDKGAAKERISNAIWGFVLLISTYVILNTINPDILTFKDLSSYGTISTGTSELSSINAAIKTYKIVVRNNSTNTEETESFVEKITCESRKASLGKTTAAVYITYSCETNSDGEKCFTYYKKGNSSDKTTVCYPNIRQCEAAKQSKTSEQVNLYTIISSNC